MVNLFLAKNQSQFNGKLIILPANGITRHRYTKSEPQLLFHSTLKKSLAVNQSPTCKMIKYLQENKGGNFSDLGFGKKIFKKTQKP